MREIRQADTSAGLLDCDTNTETETEDKHDVEMARVTEDGTFLNIEQETPKPRALRALYLQFRRDRVLRLKMLHTGLISWAAAVGGWRLAMIGPTFPDLMQIIDVDVSVGSWLLTAFYIGNLTGSLIGGFMYERLSKICVIVGWLVVLAGSAAVISWCTSFPTMVIANVIGGASFGAIDVVAITDVIHVWKGSSVYVLQFVHFCYTVGAIISPLASAPFLSRKTTEDTMLTPSNTSAVYTPDKFTAVTESLKVSVSNNTNATFAVEYGESRVHVVYIISAILSMSNAVMFIVVYALNGNVYRIFDRDTSEAVSQSRTKSTHKFSTKTKIYFVCFLTLLFMLHMITERMFSSYLSSYVTTTKGWDKTAGSEATSVYWIAAAISRLIATTVLVFVKLTRVMLICLSISLVGIAGLLLTLYIDSDALIWTVVAVLGVGLAPLYSGWFTWLSENVLHASGKITSFMYVTAVTACSLLPPLLGYLMKNYTYNWLVYILLILIPSMFVLFVCVVLIHRCLRRH